MHPAQMLVGMISMVLCSFIFTYVSSEGKLIHDLKRQYPAVGVFLVISSVCCLTYTLGSLLIFLLGILLPLSGKKTLISIYRSCFEYFVNVLKKVQKKYIIEYSLFWKLLSWIGVFYTSQEKLE